MIKFIIKINSKRKHSLEKVSSRDNITMGLNTTYLYNKKMKHKQEIYVGNIFDVYVNKIAETSAHETIHGIINKELYDNCKDIKKLRYYINQGSEYILERMGL